MKWHTQGGKINTNLNIKIDLTLSELSATEMLTCDCHVDEYTKGRYDIILGRDILNFLVLNLKWSNHVIEADGGPFKKSTAPIFDLGTYEFKDLEARKITPE